MNDRCGCVRAHGYDLTGKMTGGGLHSVAWASASTLDSTSVIALLGYINLAHTPAPQQLRRHPATDRRSDARRPPAAPGKLHVLTHACYARFRNRGYGTMAWCVGAAARGLYRRR